MRRLLAHFLVPHRLNNFHPHSIRPKALTFYLAAILLIQLFYNLNLTGQAQVLSFATDINQTSVITYTNEERVKAGVNPLKENMLLSQAAAKKAADMFAENYWAHVAPSGTTPWYFFDQVGYRYTYAGENLARDFDTSSGVVSGWMGSLSHRENLLSSKYTEIGVAVVNGVLLDHETTLVVQLFGQPQLGLTTHGAPVSAELSQVAIETPVLSAPQALAEKDVSFQPDLLALSHLNSGQKLTLLLLVPLFAFFLFDAVVLIRRGHLVDRGHSLSHAGIIGLVILVFLTSSFGVLR